MNNFNYCWHEQYHYNYITVTNLSCRIICNTQFYFASSAASYKQQFKTPKGKRERLLLTPLVKELRKSVNLWHRFWTRVEWFVFLYSRDNCVDVLFRHSEAYSLLSFLSFFNFFQLWFCCWVIDSGRYSISHSISFCSVECNKRQCIRIRYSISTSAAQHIRIASVSDNNPCLLHQRVVEIGDRTAPTGMHSQGRLLHINDGANAPRKK